MELPVSPSALPYADVGERAPHAEVSAPVSSRNEPGEVPGLVVVASTRVYTIARTRRQAHSG